MTTEESEHLNFTEEDCPFDCEACPYGLTAMECHELYERFIQLL